MVMNLVQTAEETSAELRTLLQTATISISEEDSVHMRVVLHNGFSFSLPADFNADHLNYVVAAVLLQWASRRQTQWSLHCPPVAVCAEQSFRQLKGFNWLAEVIRGVKLVDRAREDQQLAAA